ncbi:MAG: hypothetical protein US86_C0002G0074 [Candidatus Daviesbacteria bacterium GW2011_GWA2_38_24]|uniref:Uncharacterized protein n=1 Tax=Candidatus Daviesbacteria bacterium GW2011_GWA2_38_24 TaxID=1618422 RepID=A0A0G0JJD6_9BACT|nr:MAG: hypothetical protein US86_C0002G0074 [Candidatus Daviesbacteria bacterium GW2011_GWA2_38_24]OGE23244.1 MAG: hypothetical protein A2688_02650 [Candidatus Daviesbacteria bacterium RIFCSPHIGHO2_01_FULL_38_8]
MNYKGVIIEESLGNKDVLKLIKVLSTKVEKVTKSHQTLWLSQWTLHTVEIPEEKAELVANQLSKDLETEHEWYADFKNSASHYIIFRNKVFKVNRNKSEEYEVVKKYGISLGIPDHQLDFSPDVQV